MDAASLSKVLYVDLGRKRSWVEEKPQLFENTLGGTGVGIRLLLEECPQGANPLGPENPIIFSIGYLNAIFPLGSKTVAMFKSPLTGNLGESHGGGRSGVAQRMAGYGAMVIRGKSDAPVYLVIDSGGVKIKDASSLWGMNSSSTVGRIIRENEVGAGSRAIMRIGKAGERLISYACVITETYRHFGRLGFGAVFGSKRLKAIMISGRASFSLKDPKLYREAYDDIFNTVTKSPLMKKYHELGTPMNVLSLNMASSIPTKNLQSTKFEGAESLSGESLREKYLGKRAACAHCPVSCIHIAALREPYATEPYFYKTRMISYDYEPIYSLGSMLGIASVDGYLNLMDRVEEVGLDAMSTGVVLSWATEAMEKGLVGNDETNGLLLKFGDYKTYIEAVERLVTPPNDFYRALGKGVVYASSIYGGRDFALAFGGNEMPGYHTGLAAHLGTLVGARHSHLDGAGYAIDQKATASGKTLSPQEAAEELYKEEVWRQTLSSLVVCYFARNIYTPETVARCFKALGKNLMVEELSQIGRRTLRAKYEFKLKEGFSFGGLTLPKRIMEVPTPQGIIKEDDLREGIRAFESLLKKT
ncbi:MAG: aldehyde ferredoxin oxidoreductase N-terminal domain-containing protein [Candidatus Methanomethylicaceae archaeon]|jgi:aldehyde:ferredoxin oxidoreductase